MFSNLRGRLDKVFGKAFRYDEKSVWFLIATYTLILSVLTSLKHYCFRSYAFDLGIFIQVFWHTLHGNFMYAMPRWGPPIHPENFLGVHVSPLIILLLPIYYIFSSPYTLLILQSLVFALPALYIYRITKFKFMDDPGTKMPIIMAILYLVYPGTLWPNWYDFHLEAFVPLFLSMAYYYHLRRDDKKMFLSLFLLLSVFEFTAPIVLFFAIFILAKEFEEHGLKKSLNRKPLLNFLILTLVSITFFLLCQFIRKSIFPKSDPLQIFEPITFTQLMYKMAYIMMLFGPLLFLPFLSLIELIPTLPFLGLAMMSNFNAYFEIVWQYPALVSIPIFVAAISSLHKIRIKLKEIGMQLILAGICFLVLLSPISPIMASFNPYWGVHIPNERIFLMHNALSLIEPNATVLAQSTIFSNIAERKVIFTVWPPKNVIEPPDYIVVHLRQNYFFNAPQENPIKVQLNELLANYSYGVLASVDGFIIFKKGYNEDVKVYLPYRTILNAKDVVLEQGISTYGNEILVPKNHKGYVWKGPWRPIPPGKYKVEIPILVSEEVEGSLIRFDVIEWLIATYVSRTIEGEELSIGKWNTIYIDFEIDKIVPIEIFPWVNCTSTDIQIGEIKLTQVGL